MRTDKNLNQKTHTKTIRKGMSLYKTGRSPYWFVRIWIGGEKNMLSVQPRKHPDLSQRKSQRNFSTI